MGDRERENESKRVIEKGIYIERDVRERERERERRETGKERARARES